MRTPINHLAWNFKAVKTWTIKSSYKNTRLKANKKKQSISLIRSENVRAHPSPSGMADAWSKNIEKAPQSNRQTAIPARSFRQADPEGVVRRRPLGLEWRPGLPREGPTLLESLWPGPDRGFFFPLLRIKKIFFLKRKKKKKKVYSDIFWHIHYENFYYILSNCRWDYCILIQIFWYMKFYFKVICEGIFLSSYGPVSYAPIMRVWVPFVPAGAGNIGCYESFFYDFSKFEY